MATFRRGDFLVRPKITKSRLAPDLNLGRVLEDLRGQGRVSIEFFFPRGFGNDGLPVYVSTVRHVAFAGVSDWLNFNLDFLAAEAAFYALENK